MTYITIPTRDHKQFEAYIAMPEVLPAPAIVVIQEIFGVNADLRKKCDELAELGYIAISPDLFWRMEPGVQLTDKTEEEWAKAFDFFNRFDTELGVSDLRDTVHTLKGHADCTSKIGAVGYCLGGKLSYLLGANSTIDGCVSYYGVGLEELTDKADDIKSPALLHIAEEDEYVSKDAQATIKSGLSGNNHIEIQSYAGVNHAFARDEGVHYDEAAATLANKRTAEFFQKNLKE